MFKRRLFAYAIDMIILSFVLFIVSSLFPVDDSLNNLGQQLLELSNSFANNEIGISTFINRYAVINYSISKFSFLPNLIGVFFSICYFVVYPIYNNGSSIGKKIMKLRVVNLDDSLVSTNRMLLRYMFIEGIGVSILSLSFIFVLSDIYYMIFVFLLDFLQFIVVISSFFMILYMRDFRSLPDLIAGTKVIEVKE